MNRAHTQPNLAEHNSKQYNKPATSEVNLTLALKGKHLYRRALKPIRFVALLAAIVAGWSFATVNKTVNIAPRASVELSYPEFKEYDVQIMNTSGKSIDISVIDRNTGQQLKGFGLSAKSDATVIVNQDILKIRNRSGNNTTVELTYLPKKQKTPSNDVYVSFTMINNTLYPIPLVIPDVMNPNLSPLSGSGVNLKIGQEIYFRYRGNTELLMVIDQNIGNGAKLNMAQVIKRRKKELRKKIKQ